MQPIVFEHASARPTLRTWRTDDACESSKSQHRCKHTAHRYLHFSILLSFNLFIFWIKIHFWIRDWKWMTKFLFWETHIRFSNSMYNGAEAKEWALRTWGRGEVDCVDHWARREQTHLRLWEITIYIAYGWYEIIAAADFAMTHGKSINALRVAEHRADSGAAQGNWVW